MVLSLFTDVRAGSEHIANIIVPGGRGEMTGIHPGEVVQLGETSTQWPLE
jgi:hypothetical protein